MEREARIKKEVTRLKRIYKDLEGKRKNTVEGLIQRAAYMRISLEDLEWDLNQKGFVEYFSQGAQEPYERKRPTAEIYNSMNTNYQKIIKQLTDLLPRIEPKVEKQDSFEAFISERSDD